MRFTTLRSDAGKFASMPEKIQRLYNKKAAAIVKQQEADVQEQEETEEELIQTIYALAIENAERLDMLEGNQKYPVLQKATKATPGDIKDIKRRLQSLGLTYELKKYKPKLPGD